MMGHGIKNTSKDQLLGGERKTRRKIGRRFHVVTTKEDDGYDSVKN